MDWREFISDKQIWRKVELPASLKRAIVAYMGELGLDFGRLDMLLDKEGQYHFCEVNPNGQFAWLDLNDEHGLLSKVIEEISPVTACYPIPHAHPSPFI